MSTALTEKQRRFLYKLADLCEEYEINFEYTTDDDGIHIFNGGTEIFRGFMFDTEDATAGLRAVADA